LNATGYRHFDCSAAGKPILGLTLPLLPWRRSDVVLKSDDRRVNPIREHCWCSDCLWDRYWVAPAWYRRRAMRAGQYDAVFTGMVTDIVDPELAAPDEATETHAGFQIRIWRSGYASSEFDTVATVLLTRIGLEAPPELHKTILATRGFRQAQHGANITFDPGRSPFTRRTLTIRDSVARVVTIPRAP